MKTILIIDDDPVIRTLLRHILEAEGYGVREAENGKEGMRSYVSSPADMVIVDIFMPLQDGLETIRELASMLPTCTIMAISDGGNIGGTDFLRMARTFGAHAALTKPLDRRQVVTAVNRLMS